MSSFAWELRGAIMVAVPHKPPPIESPPVVDVHTLLACPTCHARVDERCKTPSGGRLTKPHVARLAPRLCECGALLDFHRKLCDACRVELRRETWRAATARRAERLRA